ncbi:MAG: lytic murein transglycosylase B [Pseudomonadota bacterium]
MMARTIRAMTALTATLILSATSHALDVQRDDVKQFIDMMVNEHGFERDALIDTLTGAKKQQSILDAISRPAERSKPWHDYRDIFIQDKRINAGVEFWNTHEETIARISDETGVPGEILVGIIGVETYYGRITGKYRVLDALATLGFDYPPRSKFFRKELAEFLILAREEQVDVDAALGSYAGAMGSPQFIPSSYRHYAVDADGDGRRDLFSSWEDIIGSVANYFVRHGWRSDTEVVASATLGSNFSGEVPKKNRLKTDDTIDGLSEKGVMFSTGLAGDEKARLIAFDGESGPKYYVGFHNFYVITRYNRSAMYAMAVWQLGNDIAAAREADAQVSAL